VADQTPIEVIYQDQIKRLPTTPGRGPSGLGVPVAPTLGPRAVYSQCRLQQYNFTSNLFIPYDESRVYLMIQNTGATTMYIDFSGVVGTTSAGLQLPGSKYAYYEPIVIPVTGVNITGTGAAFVGSKFPGGV